MPLIKSNTSVINNTPPNNSSSSPPTTKSFIHHHHPQQKTKPLARDSNETHFMTTSTTAGSNTTTASTAKRIHSSDHNNDDYVDIDDLNGDDDDDNDRGVNNKSGKSSTSMTMRFPSISSTNNKFNQCFKLTPSNNKSLIFTDKESFCITSGGDNEEEENPKASQSNNITTAKSLCTTPTSMSGLACYTPINSIKHLPSAIFSPQFNENLANLNRKWTKFNRRSHRRRNSSSGDSKELDKLVLKSMEWDDNDIY